MIKERVGIITFFHSRNYGAVLQCYALQMKLKEKFEYVEVINYKNAEIEKNIKLWNWPERKSVKAYTRAIASFVFRAKKKQVFDRFISKYLTLSDEIKKTELSILNSNYDCLVTGSDQVWNNKITGGDKSFFLDFAEAGTQKIAFSVSVGDDNVEFDDDILKLISTFHFLSFREQKCKERLQTILENDLYHICDPTILLTKQEWGMLVRKRIIKKPYIFVFMIEESKSLLQYAQKIASEKGLTVFSNKNCMSFMANMSPVDFLSWIKNAEYVVTNSFHATVFSLQFEKLFSYQKYKEHGGYKARIVELLESVELQDRFIENDDFVIDTEINWQRVNALVEEMRKDSWECFEAYLKRK